MVLSMERWVGKVAVVTGASSGIGAAIVDQLVEKGMIVVGIARRSELIEQKAKQCCGKKGKLHAVKADMSKEEEIIKAFKWICTNVGPVHVLVNNAGIALMGSLLETGPQDWKKTVDLNIVSLCTATKEAIKIMKDKKINGHIININSTFGHFVPSHTWNVYPASKFAVTALNETIRLELSALGTKIKVTSVSPGLVATELTTMNKDAPAEVKAHLSKMPILKAEDIADGVVYALSTPPHAQVHELTIQAV